MRELREKYPNALLFGVGWSLGANILLRYLAEEGSEAPLAGAVSLCNPFNLVGHYIQSLHCSLHATLWNLSHVEKKAQQALVPGNLCGNRLPL